MATKFSARRILALRNTLNEFAAAHRCPEHPDSPLIIHQVGNAWCADCGGPGADKQISDGSMMSSPKGESQACFYHVHIAGEDD